MRGPAQYYVENRTRYDLIITKAYGRLYFGHTIGRGSFFRLDVGMGIFTLPISPELEEFNLLKNMTDPLWIS